MGKKADETREYWHVRVKRFNDEREAEFHDAMKVIMNRGSATLHVEGHSVPVVISGVEISRDQHGPMDITITIHPQPPRTI